jgi:Circularly permutated YpsA SLOG family
MSFDDKSITTNRTELALCSDDSINSFVMIQKIVSGGQTGADRTALDWAIWHDIPHGGWCPKGRKAEDGPIGSNYLLKETPTSSYPQRTEGMFETRMAPLSSQLLRS